MYTVLIILILLMPVPLYIGFMSLFANKHRQKSQVTVKDALKRLIKRYRLSIGEINIFGNNLISFDRKKNKMVLVVYKNEITWEKCVDVQEIISCQIEKEFNIIGSSIQKVNLELAFRSEEPINLSFFDQNIDDPRDLPSRIKKAEYWREKIRSRIRPSQIANIENAAM